MCSKNLNRRTKMSTFTFTAESLSRETGLPKWWLEVALGERSLEHDAETASEALRAYHKAEKGSFESAAAYKRYSELQVVHEKDVSDLDIRRWAAYRDFYERLDKTTSVDEVVGMINEPSVIPGSPLWDAALQQLMILKKAQRKPLPRRSRKRK